MEKQFLKQLLRSQVETFIDFQKERIAFGNRLVQNFRYKLGQDPGQPLDDSKALRILNELKAEAKRITDAIAGKKLLKNFFKRNEGLISNAFEYEYVKQYLEIEDQEKQALKVLSHLLEYFPIWTEWLSKVEGVGPTIGGYIIAWLDPQKAPRPSCFWRYAGLHVVDGRAPQRKKGEKAPWNHRLRAKLLGVLGDQFVRRPQSCYGQIYRGYKARLENREDWKDTTPGHRHRAAIRYAVKIFLLDLWLVWRKLEGLPVVPPYHEAKLGLKHAGLES